MPAQEPLASVPSGENATVVTLTGPVCGRIVRSTRARVCIDHEHAPLLGGHGDPRAVRGHGDRVAVRVQVHRLAADEPAVAPDRKLPFAGRRPAILWESRAVPGVDGGDHPAPAAAATELTCPRARQPVQRRHGLRFRAAGTSQICTSPRSAPTTRRSASPCSSADGSPPRQRDPCDPSQRRGREEGDAGPVNGRCERPPVGGDGEERRRVQRLRPQSRDRPARTGCRTVDRRRGRTAGSCRRGWACRASCRRR